MSAWVAIVGVAFLAFNLAVNAGVLWVAFKLLRVPPHPFHPEGITYRAALAMTVAIFLFGWGIFAGITFGILCGFPSLSAVTVAKFLLPPLGILIPLYILRVAAPHISWWRTLGVWVVWRVASLAQAGLVLFVLRTCFADALPEGWLDSLP